jgi:hypothetical protein
VQQEEQPHHHGAHDDVDDGRAIELVLLADEQVLEEHGEHRDPDTGMLLESGSRPGEVVEREPDAPDGLCVRTRRRSENAEAS